MTRSMLATYVGARRAADDLLRLDRVLPRPEFERIVALVDPFGLGAFTLATKYWTAAERNTQLPAMAGVILWNRVIWLGAASCCWAPPGCCSDAKASGRARRWLEKRWPMPSRCAADAASGSPACRQAQDGCRQRHGAQLAGAGALRHDGGLPQPGVLRPARHSGFLNSIGGTVVRQRGSVRESRSTR